MLKKKVGAAGAAWHSREQSTERPEDMYLNLSSTLAGSMTLGI